jgi:hypothetical protein
LAESDRPKRVRLHPPLGHGKTSKPVRFPNTIDCCTSPGDDPEFIFAFNRMRFWVTLGQAYVLTGNETYARRSSPRREAGSTPFKRDDPPPPTRGGPSRRGSDGELDESHPVFQGSPALTDDFLDLFSKSMREHFASSWAYGTASNMLSNWGVLANHGLFMASTLLPRTERDNEGHAEAIRRLLGRTLHAGVHDGVQWEQSAMYHNEVLHDYLDVAVGRQEAWRSTSPTFTNRVHKMARLPLRGRNPTGKNH